MTSTRPSIALLHYSAPPVVGGVEAVLAEHARLFVAAGYPTHVVVGRGGTAGLPEAASVSVIPEMDSEHPENQAVAAALPPTGSGGGGVPPEFDRLRDRIEAALTEALAEAQVVVAHNVLTMHFNLPLVAALHRLADRGRVRGVIVWTHDVSRHVSPTGSGTASGAPRRSGPPWDLLRTFRPDFGYVAVSSQRQRLLADVLGCSRERIHVVPNGVDVALLLGLSGLGQHLADEFGLLSADLAILMPIRITRAKNIEYALHVAAALKAAGIRLRLVLTGPPDPHVPNIESYYAGLHALRRSLALEAEVIFVYEGTSRFARPLLLDLPVVAELYRLCDLVLMPSHREGFGMPVLEAGLMDRPIFATQMPVLEELGDGLVHPIAPDEPPERVAARMLEWAGQAASHRLRRRVRQAYTWPAIFAQSIQPLIAARLTTPDGSAP